MPQETLKYTVKWFMPDKKLIKFNESAEDYTLSEKVAKFDHAKYGVKTGAKVDVSIVGKEVTYLRKSEDAKEAPKTEEKQPPKEESKPETKTGTQGTEPAKESDVFTWTVAGIPADKKVISFKESNAVRWYLVPEELRGKLDELGVKARIVVKVTLTTIKEGDKDKPAIKTIEVAEQPTEAPKEETQGAVTQDNPTTSRGRTATGDSIERQCAWKGACHAIGTATGGQVSLNDIGILTEKIKLLAEEGIKFIQKS